MMDFIRDRLFNIAIIILIMFLCIALINKDREFTMNNCLELGNSVTQCEKLFE